MVPLRFSSSRRKLGVSTFGQDKLLRDARSIFGVGVYFGARDCEVGEWRLVGAGMEICRGTRDDIAQWLRGRGARECAEIFHALRDGVYDGGSHDAPPIVDTVPEVVQTPPHTPSYTPTIPYRPWQRMLPSVSSDAARDETTGPYDPRLVDIADARRKQAAREEQRARKRALNARQVDLPHAPHRVRACAGFSARR